MIWNCYRNFYCKDFGHCIDWLQLAAQSLYRIFGHPEVFTANNNKMEISPYALYTALRGVLYGHLSAVKWVE